MTQVALLMSTKCFLSSTALKRRCSVTIRRRTSWWREVWRRWRSASRRNTYIVREDLSQGCRIVNKKETDWLISRLPTIVLPTWYPAGGRWIRLKNSLMPDLVGLVPRGSNTKKCRTKSCNMVSEKQFGHGHGKLPWRLTNRILLIISLQQESLLFHFQNQTLAIKQLCYH